MALLAARARRAFQEYTPMRFDPADPERIYRACRFGPLVDIFGFDMRSYRGANSTNRQTAVSDGVRDPRRAADRLAEAPARWHRRPRGRSSRATCRLGSSCRDGSAIRGCGQSATTARRSGRELEIAGLLRFIRDRRIRNVVFITGDVHYCAAHHYDPARAQFTEFHPFWEFVAGPAHAGTFGPAALDRHVRAAK